MIIGLGETVYDIIFKNDQPQRGVPGGSAFNAMISIGRSLMNDSKLPSARNNSEPKFPSAMRGRGRAMMVTEVGDDHIGDIVTQFLKDNGVDTTFVYRHKGTKSHISLAFLDENNDAHYQFYKDHAALNMPDVMPRFNRGDIVLFGSFFAINPVIRPYVKKFLTTAREQGVILYYDINFRAAHKDDIPQVMGNIEENMKLATILRGSAEDFNILFGTNTGQEAYECVKHFCDTFIYTDAANPIQVFMPQGVRCFPAEVIETVSTIGAGDNFNAGFCYALHNMGYGSDLCNADCDDKLKLNEAMPILVESGQKFAAEVCQSIDNYIAIRS